MAKAPPQRREIQSQRPLPPVANIFGSVARGFCETPKATIAAGTTVPTALPSRRSFVQDPLPGHPDQEKRGGAGDAWPGRRDRFPAKSPPARTATTRSAAATGRANRERRRV